MDYLTQFGLDRSRLTVLAMVGLLLIGGLLYNGFPKREDPEISIRQAVVSAQFSGMSPQRIERLVADPIERKIREIPEIDEIRSRVSTGEAVIDVILKDSVTDLGVVWQELRDKMEEIERELPTGTNGPYVNSDFGDVSVASVALTAEGFSMREMEMTAEVLQRLLYSVDGIAKVELYGVQDERIWLEVNTERLASIGVQLQTLIEDLQNQNVILPAGKLNAAGTSILLESSGDFSSVEEISKMITQVQVSGSFIRLGDIVSVKRGNVSPKEEPVFFDGREAVVVSVQMQSGYDIEALGDRVSAVVRNYEATLPIGYALNFATFQPAKVSAAVNSAVSNVLQTFLIVLLVIVVFLGFKPGLIAASIVPLSILFALIGMKVFNIELEQISIAAIIISLGLLVDNGVVIVEDVLSKVQNGESSRDAALAAGKQYAVPLLVSSATTIFAFIPFFLLEGGDGEYAFSLGAVVALTLIGSWLSALYFLPLIASHTLGKSQSISAKKKIGFDVWIAKLTKSYAANLPVFLNRAPFVVILSYVGVVCGLALLSAIPQQMFPLGDRSQVLIYQDMPKGTDISATEAAALNVSQWLLDEPMNQDIENHVLYVASGGPRFYLALDPAERAPESAFFLVNMTDYQSTVEFAKRAQRYLYENHPEARFKVKRLSMGPSESGIVKIRVSGEELDTLMLAAKKIENAFDEVHGVSENKNDWGEKSIKVVIDIDQDKARRIGISSQSMAQLLSAYFDGYEISNYREDDRSIPIVMRASERSRDGADDLLNLIVDTGNEAVALEQIARLMPQMEYSQIRRFNQVRSISVSAKSEKHTAQELLAAIQPRLESLDLPPNYAIEIEGEVADSAEINGNLAAGLPAALFLMLTAIVFQFNSYRRTLLIFTTIPLMVIGVPLGLWFFQLPVSFFGTLGLISLAGIIINNAIVLIDQIDIERQKYALDDAIVRASAQRLRPILLTSATTVIGLIPLFIFGGALWQPLAVVMMSGLLFASILVVFFVPAAYKLLFKRDEVLGTHR